MPISRVSSLGFFVVLSLGLLATPVRSLADHPPGDTTETLTAQLHTFLAGASINDRATHDAFWAEDLIYTSSSGQRFGKDTILTGLEAPVTDTAPQPVYTAADIRVQDFGNTAVITFRLLASDAGERIAEYLNTGVFRQTEGRWQAVTWQATRAAETD